MKKIYLILAVIALALFAGCSSTNTTTTTVTYQITTNSLSNTGKNWNINIQNFAFTPNSLTISKGDTVTWQNMDTVSHTIVSDEGTEIKSDALANGGTYSHTFESSGTYNYHCSIHPSMKASIVVQ